MKKFLLAIAMVCVSVAGMAQETPTMKYSVATNGFWNNWFVQAGANYSAFYSDEEFGMHLDASPFKSYRATPGASIAIGKWFTPGLALRTKVTGIWGRAVMSDSKDINDTKYFVATEQAMFNLNNLFCGYKPTRIWNFSVFAGAGVNRDMTHNKYAMVYTAGINSAWNISKKFNVYVEAGALLKEADSDGFDSNPANGYIWNHDNQLYAEVGLTYNLGKSGFNKTPDMDAINALHQSEIDALNAQVNDANAENGRLKKLLKDAENKPAVVKTVKETIALPASVFFNIGKSKIASKKDLVNVQEIANYAKDNNTKVTVIGYADSATGSADFNQKLSEARANTVAEELVKMGVSRDNIIVKGEGGVDVLSPVVNNRRAIVKVGE